MVYGINFGYWLLGLMYHINKIIALVQCIHRSRYLRININFVSVTSRTKFRKKKKKLDKTKKAY